jgi:hypothetical protein
MPAYDVEVSTELWYRLSETASDNETKYGTKANVFLERTLQAGGWNTFCAPFAISNPASVFGTGVQVKAFNGSSLSDGTLTLNFTDAAAIAAATPYLIKLGGESNVDLTAEGKEFEGVTQSWTPIDVNPDDGLATFKAALVPVPMTANDKTILFVSGGDNLTFPNTDNSLKAFRAYFQLSQAMEARAFVMNLGDDTGIRSLTSEGWHGYRSEGSKYTLDGRKVAQPTRKGVYIVNGKKTVIK